MGKFDAMGLLWLLIIILFFASINTFLLNFVSSSNNIASHISLQNHCASIIPLPSPKRLKLITSYKPLVGDFGYSNDGGIINFIILKLYKTSVQDLFNVEGSLTLDRLGTYDSLSPITLSNLYGFWLESSGEICMVSSSHSDHIEKGTIFNLPSLLKLYNVKFFSPLTTLINGTLQSLVSPDESKNNNKNDSNYFETISMTIIPMMNYEYTIATNDFYNTPISSKSDFTSAGLPLNSLPNENFCSIYNVKFNLKYVANCLTYPKNCTPFDSSIDILPRVMILNVLECYEKQQRLRVLMKFPSSDNQNGDFFSLNSVLIGEGLWDSKNNQINIVACRFLDVGIVDCSTKLSLRYPAIWKIGKMYRIDGYLWSNKTKAEIGYFDKIRLTSFDTMMPKGLKYEYTKIDKVMKLCPTKRLVTRNNTELYPSAFSYDMRFDISVTSNNKEIACGNFFPISVGDEFPFLYPQQRQQQLVVDPTNENIVPFLINMRYENPINVSYSIGITMKPDVNLGSEASIFNESSIGKRRVVVYAEGMYDDRRGRLCMVGCRNLGLNSHLIEDHAVVDCEIIVKVQFYQRNELNQTVYVKGSIESTRDKSDSLHFGRLDFCNCYA